MFHVLFPVVSYILRKVNSQSGGSTDIRYLGYGTSVDVSAVLAEYPNATIDNFFIAGSGAGGINSGSLSCSGMSAYQSAESYYSQTSFSGLSGLSLSGNTLSIGERSSLSGSCRNSNKTTTATPTYQSAKSAHFYFVPTPLTTYM